jgi:hypothetical protein
MKYFLMISLVWVGIGCKNNADADNTLPVQQARWEYRSGKYAEKPIVIRINRAIESLVDAGRLNYQLAAEIPILHPLKTGLPDDEELQKLQHIEKGLVEKFEGSGLAVYALQISSDSTCTCIFYTNNKKEVTAVCNDMDPTVDGYTIVFTIKYDKKWITYQWFSSWE